MIDITSRIDNPWNYAVCYLETMAGQHTLSRATGFFWRHADRILLVSNWHVLSGRHPETRQPQHPFGPIPERLMFTGYQATPIEGSDDLNLKTAQVEVEMQHNEAPTWFEHPTQGAAVDIAFIDVTEAVQRFELHIKPANELEPDALPEFYPSQDVFIIGYPLGLVAQVPVPVWKRGTIATEPNFDPDGRPIVYVDSATRQGMSGSIVLARHEFMGGYKKRDGTKEVVLFARKDLILGIYSGRLSPHQVEAQLGIVWKRHLIDETTAARKIGSSSL